MKITFYQVTKLFIDNSSYLGELIELKNKEFNTNMSNITSFKLLLDFQYADYNYIKVEKSETDYYYYYLESQTYYNQQKLNLFYKIDILRTLREKELLNHDINITRYSNVLDMPDDKKKYFWKNQTVKLSSNLVDTYIDNHIKYSSDKETQEAWKDMKWLYIWLQPRTIQDAVVDGANQIYQYNFTKQITESIIEIANEADLLIDTQIGIRNPYYNVYPEGQAYKAVDTAKYYRCNINWKYVGISSDRFYFKILEPLQDFEYTKTDYYLHTIPEVKIKNVPNSLYCLVLPMKEVITIRRYFENGTRKSKSKSWSADNIIPYLFDVEATNNWNDYIVDIKVSLIPPLDLDSPKYSFELLANAADYDKLAIVISEMVNGEDFTPLDTLSANTVRAYSGVTAISDIFIPFLRTKPINLIQLDSEFDLPEITKVNVIQKKFYLATVEQRKEIDIVLLQATNANKLYYYEDLFPGRTNIVYGFAPEFKDIKKTLYYLLHSPSTIFFDRDTSLPIFTSNYQTYISNNKNFIKQAQLQRNSDLAQSLISSGSSMVGAASVAKTLEGYSPNASVANSLGKTVNAGITYGVQLKQFNWTVENMKAAPGNYKAASATVSFMLSLDIFNLWIETFKSSPLGIAIYEDLINDVGYEYFNFSFKLNAVIANVFTGTSNKKFLQASLTGLTNNVQVNLPLVNILYKYLKEGVNIFL